MWRDGEGKGSQGVGHTSFPRGVPERPYPWAFMKPATAPPFVIPGRAAWRGPGIHTPGRLLFGGMVNGFHFKQRWPVVMDSQGAIAPHSSRYARPGMTSGGVLAAHFRPSFANSSRLHG